MEILDTQGKNDGILKIAKGILVALAAIGLILICFFVADALIEGADAIAKIDWAVLGIGIAMLLVAAAFVAVEKTPTLQEWHIEIGGVYSKTWKAGIHLRIRGVSQVSARVDMRETLIEDIYGGDEDDEESNLDRMIEVLDGSLGLFVSYTFKVKDSVQAHYQLIGGFRSLEKTVTRSMQDFLQTIFQSKTAEEALQVRGSRLDDLLQGQEEFEALRMQFQTLLMEILGSLDPLQAVYFADFKRAIDKILVPFLERELLEQEEQVLEEEEQDDLREAIATLSIELAVSLMPSFTSTEIVEALEGTSSNRRQRLVDSVEKAWKTVKKMAEYRAFVSDHARWGIKIMTLMVQDWELSPDLKKSRETAAQEAAATKKEQLALETERLRGEALANRTRAHLRGLAKGLAGYTGADDEVIDEAKVLEMIPRAEEMYLQELRIAAIKPADKLIVGNDIGTKIGQAAVDESVRGRI